MIALGACAEDGALSPAPEGDPAAVPDGGADLVGGDHGNGVDCVSTKSFFAERVWQPIMSTKCIACHNPQGQASHTKLVLMNPAMTGFLDLNYATVADVAAYEYQGESILTLKPVGELGHEGKVVIDAGSEEHLALQSLVEQLADPIECETDSTDVDGFFQPLALHDAQATWRRATLVLGARMPTLDEEASLAVSGEAALNALLDGLLEEEGFYSWLERLYLDRFLTDRYLAGEAALNLLSTADYPDRKWYSDVETPALADPMLVQLGAAHTNRAVAREASELIVHVVRAHRPLTEILTADYTVVNPYSALTYGVAHTVEFDNPYDPEEFREAQIPDIPHAGVLTTPMFLVRFPTTDTNRNRHRARILFDFFLATDVLALADQPVDPTSIEDHNPTMFNPECAVCHGTIDPVAGAFQNWSAGGRYMPPEEGWHPDMRPPGFGEADMAYEDRFQALQWLAGQVVQDERFATSALWIVYEGLTGQKPLRMPDDAAIGSYAAELEAYEMQQALFEPLLEAFVEGGHELRILVRGVVTSPWFRAAAPRQELTSEQATALANVGPARLLTPEMLSGRIEAVTGLPWSAKPTTTPYLLDDNYYLIFYGGMDSDDVTKRITTPNGLMASVVQRMANEVSCKTTGADFTRPLPARLLFPYVEPSFEPEDINGFPVPKAVDAIRENIRYLHGWLLDEWLPADDPVLAATYGLFYDTWREGRAAVEAGMESNRLESTCRATKDLVIGSLLPVEDRIDYDEPYTVRSWMAVMTYLLSDFRFLYQ